MSSPIREEMSLGFASSSEPKGSFKVFERLSERALKSADVGRRQSSEIAIESVGQTRRPEARRFERSGLGVPLEEMSCASCCHVARGKA